MSRRIVLWVALVGAVVLAATHTSDLVALWNTFVTGDPVWLAAALGLQVVYYVCYIATYRGGFRAVGVRRRFAEMVAPVFGSIFVNTVAPTGGAAGQALIVDDAIRKGGSPSRSTAALIVAQATDMSGFSVILLLGMGYLAITHRIDAAEIAATLVLLGAIGAFAGVLILGLVRPMLVGALFARLERVSAWAFRLLRREAPHSWSEAAADEFVSASQALAHDPLRPLSTFAIAVTGHAADVVSFICIGLAFGMRSPAPLLAAYSVSVLFWIVAIVPQGVGVSEGAAALVLTSFGAPPSTALAVSLVFRGMSFWIPFAIGFALIGRAGGVDELKRPATADTRTVRIAAAFTFLVGVMNVLSAVTPNLAARMPRIEKALPLQVHYGHLAAALAGVALVYLSRGLLERKRAAWWVALGALAFSVLSHVVKGLDFEEALIAAVLLVWLLGKRHVFHARSDMPSVRKGVRGLAASLTFTLAYGTAGFYLLDRHFSVNFGLKAAMDQTLAMFLAFRDPGLEPLTGFGRWFADSIYVIGAVTLGYGLLQLLRPVISRGPSSAHDRSRARAIAEEWGASSLARIAVLPDKAFCFSPGGSVVCYTVRGGYAIALGDAIGPDDDVTGAVETFRTLCVGNGWVPVLYQTTGYRLSTYADMGFKSLRVGHEAVVDVKSFSLAGKSHKSLRNRINRMAEEGITTRVIDPPLAADLVDRLRVVSDAWLTEMHGTEKRFSLGWFDDDYIREGAVFIVEDAAGEIQAFANVLPEYRLNETTIDLMRHLPTAPPGTMDLMFVRLFEWAASAGYDSFNLGLAPLAGVGDEPGDPLTEKAMRLVYEYANAFYSFQGLREYKAKFDPEWQPRYLVFPAAANPLAVVGAVAAASGDENMIVEYGRDLFRRIVPV